MEGIGNSEGMGGQRPRRGQCWTIKITFQEVNFELSAKIATY